MRAKAGVLREGSQQADLRQIRDETRRVGQGEEALEPLLLLFPERIIQAGEVGLELLRGQGQAVFRLPSLQGGARIGLEGAERARQFAAPGEEFGPVAALAPHHPEPEDEGEPLPGAPGGGEVRDVRPAVGHALPQGLVADQQEAVRLAEVGIVGAGS